MGDEVRRTQDGNNNAYCQDNETSWLDWTLLDKHADVHRFAGLLNAHRQMRDFQPEHEHLSLNELLREGNWAWHGVKPGAPDWSFESHSLAYFAACPNANLFFYLIFNAYWKTLEFELPPTSRPEERWHRWIDTSLPSREDIQGWQTAPAVIAPVYHAGPRSVVAFFARALLS